MGGVKASKATKFMGLEKGLYLNGNRFGQQNVSNKAKSQNHLGWKGPHGIIQPSPPAQAGSAGAGYPGPCLVKFWISQLIFKPTPQPFRATSFCVWLPSQYFFLVLMWDFMCLNFCPLPPVLPVSTAEKGLTPLSSLLPIRYLYTLIRFPLSFPFFRLWTVPAQPLLIQKMI